MKALILKDLYQLRRYWRFYGLLAVFSYFGMLFTDSDVMFFLFYYPSILIGMVPVTLLSMDEQSGFDQFSCGLPYTRRQFVVSKLLAGLIMQGVTAALGGMMAAVQMVLHGGLTLAAWGSAMLTMTAVALGGGALVFPWVFKLGVEKGRLFYMLGVGIVCGLSVLVKDLRMLPHLDILMWVLPVAAVGGYVLSMELSVRFYERRELG